MTQHFVALLAAVLAASASGARVHGRERPVMKVVRLLQDMKTELQRDLDDDKAVHEKLDCWCKTNSREKTEAIANGEARSSELDAFLGETKGKMQEIKSNRDTTQDEVDSDWSALNKASALRMKENKEFHSEETQLLAAVQAADQAIVVLGEHHPELAQLRSVASHLRRANVLSLGAVSPAAKSEALKAFLAEHEEGQEGTASFLAIPGFQSYRPQSGQIFGILKQMKEDFERNLGDAQKREATAVKEFADLKAAKEEEISLGKKSVAQLDQDFADFGEKSAQAFQELEDTQNQLELDRAFLADLKKKCSESDAEFDARVKSRLDEISAVEDTIKILNEDAAFDTFTKTVDASFFQTSSGLSQREESARRQRAVSVLVLAASQAQSPRLSLLATRAQLDAFVKVKEEIDKMVAELQKQQEDEVEHRDWCIKEMNDNNRSQEAAYDKKASLQAKIADLEKSIESLTRGIETTTKEIAEMQEQMKRASETREAENADYQQTVTDQRLTQAILKKALLRMKEVYFLMQEDPEEAQPGAAHTALSGTHTDAGNGPARFTKYEQHKGGSRVIAMLNTVIKDSVTAEDEAIKSEQDAQTAYEDFMKQSNQMITVATKKVSDMSGARAAAKEDLVMAEKDLADTLSELEDLHLTLGNLHKACDFVLDNFSARQAARSAEVDALKEAKAILSGMH